MVVSYYLIVDLRKGHHDITQVSTERKPFLRFLLNKPELALLNQTGFQNVF